MREEKAMRKQKQKAELSLEGGWPLEAEREKKMDSPLIASRMNQSCQHLAFYPVMLILNFWPLGL